MTDFVTPALLIWALILQVFIPGFPKEVIMIQAGISYGVFLGTVINMVGIIIGAQVAYESTYLVSYLGDRFIPKFRELEQSPHAKRLQNRGNYGLFVLRLIPYSPNDVLSFLSGILKLKRPGFIAVSVITSIPYSLFFAYLGDLGRRSVGDPTLLLMINVSIAALSSIVGTSYYLYQKKNNKGEKNSVPEV